MLNKQTIDKLINGPTVLLLGQNYSENGTEGNVFLEQILKKYVPQNNIQQPTHNDLLGIGLDKTVEESAAWIDKLSKFINPTPQISRIATIPWSAIFTSAIDPVINNVFDTDWRKTQLVCDTRYRISDPRNKMNLHITKLFGCLSRDTFDQRAPLSILEKGKRKFVANTLLQRIPETLTSKGLLVIEGYKLDDWLDLEDMLYPTLSQLGFGQVIFCSVSDTLEENDFFADLVKSGKIIPHKESFAEIIEKLESEGKYKITTPEFEERFAKYLTIEGKKVKIPKELYRDISKSAIVIDDHIFDFEVPTNADEKYVQFKDFLATSNINNIWSGYPKGFAFKRDYYDALKASVIEKLKFNTSISKPIILHGQSGGGKTVSLGYLTYELFKECQLPILFIEKNYQKIDEHQIDRFCLWAQEQGARGTIIIWDGMIEIDFYFNLLERLQGRGRNIVIVGSAYTLKKETSNTIASLAELDHSEKIRFGKFIKDIDFIIANILPAEEMNILSMFYRYLPDSRLKIQQGLRSEFEHFKERIREYTNGSQDKSENRPAMFYLMEEAGLIDKNYKSEDPIDFDQSEEIDGEKITLADKLIYSVMVPGQFGIEIPFELLIRNLGFSMISSTPFRLLNIVNIINWTEDNVGNISLGPRTAMEAKILVRYLGNKRTQVEYIKSLLASISSDEFLAEGISYESNRDIQFAVDLLYNISPNGPSGNNVYSEYTYDITEVLRKLREGNFAYHPRLILKEASFLREIVKSSWNKGNETNQELLERAEDIVREALDNLKGYQEMTIIDYLRVELASIMGSKTLEFISEKDVSRAKDCYNAVRAISTPSFASNPSNYGALDVLAWTTIRLLKSDVLNEDERIEAQAALLNLFDISEAEGVSAQHYEDFNARKLSLLSIIGANALSDSLFERLAKEGSTTGYYIRTINILNETKDIDLSPDNLVLKYLKAYEYLHQFELKIQNDGRCLFLLFRCWWIQNAKSYPLTDEKRTTPLSLDQWEYCLSLTERILACNGWETIAVVIFLKGLAEFHLGSMIDMSVTFKKLDVLTDFSTYGTRRIKKSYLASSSDGKPTNFSGDVAYNVSVKRGQRFGDIYVNELKINVPFSLYEFQQLAFQKGDTLRHFQIGFNFRGPIAVFNKHD